MLLKTGRHSYTKVGNNIAWYTLTNTLNELKDFH